MLLLTILKLEQFPPQGDWGSETPPETGVTATDRLLAMAYLPACRHMVGSSALGLTEFPAAPAELEH